MTSLQRAIAPLDAVLTAVVVALSVVYMVAVVDDEGGSWAAVPLFTLVTVPLLWRRSAPLHALAGLAVAVAVHAALFGTVTRCGVVLLVAGLLAFAAGARLPFLHAVAGLGLAVGAALLMLGFDQSAPLDEAGVFAAVLMAGAWTAGAALHAVATRSSVPVAHPARS